MKKVKEVQFSRPPWQRMMRIHERLRAGKYPNCVGMAKEMSVSLRTVKRDVEFMVERLGLPIEYLRSSFSVFRGEDDYEVVIDFDVWATDLLRGRQWHRSQEFTELPGGCSQMKMRLNSLEIERWVLDWGTHAPVVRPKALRERIRATAEELAKRYAMAEG